MIQDIKRTVNQASFYRLEERKSVFIAHVSPVNNAVQAMAFIDDIRRQYADASHHVYAWKTSGPPILQKHSDDHEPSGTAGLPIIEMITRQRLQDIVIVVVRYFGGIKLGTGGLQRAYLYSAEQAIRLAQPIEWIVANRYQVMVSYAHLELVKYALVQNGIEIVSIEYNTQVLLEILCPIESVDQCCENVLDLTAGKSQMVFISSEEMKNKG